MTVQSQEVILWIEALNAAQDRKNSGGSEAQELQSSEVCDSLSLVWRWTHSVLHLGLPRRDRRCKKKKENVKVGESLVANALFLLLLLPLCSLAHVQALKPTGQALLLTGAVPEGSNAARFVVTSSGPKLAELTPFFEKGALKPILDPKGPFAFQQVKEAFAHLETGRATGKIVVGPIE